MELKPNLDGEIATAALSQKQTFILACKKPFTLKFVQLVLYRVQRLQTSVKSDSSQLEPMETSWEVDCRTLPVCRCSRLLDDTEARDCSVIIHML